jgi:hypothetical protein
MQLRYKIELLLPFIAPHAALSLSIYQIGNCIYDYFRPRS